MPSVITPPRTDHRAARCCAVIRSVVTMDQLATQLPPLGEEVLAWLTARGLEPDGPFFWRYHVIDMAGPLTVDVGLPVAQPFAGDTRVLCDTLPAGVYATARHHGHPAGLMDATAQLLAWGDAEGVAWARRAHGTGEAWRSRIEWYLHEPEDMSEWETELAFLLE